MDLDIDKYYQVLDQLADECSKSGLATHDFLESIIEAKPKFFDGILSFRKSFIGTKELEEVRGYLSIGIFRKHNGVERATCFVICFDLDEIITELL